MSDSETVAICCITVHTCHVVWFGHLGKAWSDH